MKVTISVLLDGWPGDSPMEMEADEARRLYKELHKIFGNFDELRPKFYYDKTKDIFPIMDTASNKIEISELERTPGDD